MITIQYSFFFFLVKQSKLLGLKEFLSDLSGDWIMVKLLLLSGNSGCSRGRKAKGQQLRVVSGQQQHLCTPRVLTGLPRTLWRAHGAYNPQQDSLRPFTIITSSLPARTGTERPLSLASLPEALCIPSPLCACSSFKAHSQHRFQWPPTSTH